MGGRERGRKGATEIERHRDREEFGKRYPLSYAKHQEREKYITS